MEPKSPVFKPLALSVCYFNAFLMVVHRVKGWPLSPLFGVAVDWFMCHLVSHTSCIALHHRLGVEYESKHVGNFPGSICLWPDYVICARSSAASTNRTPYFSCKNPYWVLDRFRFWKCQGGFCTYELVGNHQTEHSSIRMPPPLFDQLGSFFFVF